jgi:endoglucanase
MDLDTASRSRPNTWPLKTKSVRSASFVGVSSICLVLASLLAACSPGAHVSSGSGLQLTTAGRQCGPLHADGAHLVDPQGNRADLSGVNWFGFETESFGPQCLDVSN